MSEAEEARECDAGRLSLRVLNARGRIQNRGNKNCADPLPCQQNVHRKVFYNTTEWRRRYDRITMNTKSEETKAFFLFFFFLAIKRDLTFIVNKTFRGQ